MNRAAVKVNAENLKLLGLPGDFTLDKAGTEVAYAKCKALMIEARRNNDDEAAKLLSQCRNWIRRKMSDYCHCGHMKQRHSSACADCIRAEVARGKFGTNMKEPKEPTYEIGVIEPTLHVVPGQRGSVVLNQLREFQVHSKVADSIVLEASREVIRCYCDKLSFKMIVRKLEVEGKVMCRVWNSEGHSVEELNVIIKQRLEGTYEQTAHNNGVRRVTVPAAS